MRPPTARVRIPSEQLSGFGRNDRPDSSESADIVPNSNEVMWRVAGSGWLYVIEDPGRAGRTVVTISVTDLDQLVAELSGRGINAGPIEAVGDAGRKANVVDADGNMISWIQVAAAG